MIDGHILYFSVDVLQQGVKFSTVFFHFFVLSGFDLSFTACDYFRAAAAQPHFIIGNSTEFCCIYLYGLRAILSFFGAKAQSPAAPPAAPPSIA